MINFISRVFEAFKPIISTFQHTTNIHSQKDTWQKARVKLAFPALISWGTNITSSLSVHTFSWP